MNVSSEQSLLTLYFKIMIIIEDYNLALFKLSIIPARSGNLKDLFKEKTPSRIVKQETFYNCRYEGGYQTNDFIRFIQAKSNIVLNKEIFKTPVLVIDQFNFERIVKDRKRNVMVHYFNGFCKLCEEVEIAYSTVGNTFRYGFLLIIF